MQTTNNPLPEIGVILIALGFIAAGTTLLALGKVDLNVAMTLYILAASVAGINVALKAPSPTQQQLLVQALASQAQPAQLVQAPAPVTTQSTAAMMEQAAQYANALSMPGTVVANYPLTAPIQPIPSQLVQPAGMVIPPAGLAMPQAIMTTQNMPAV